MNTYQALTNTVIHNPFERNQLISMPKEIEAKAMVSANQFNEIIKKNNKFESITKGILLTKTKNPLNLQKRIDRGGILLKR